MTEAVVYKDYTQELVKRYTQWLENTDLAGYGYVEITDGIPDAFVPERFFAWCLSKGISPQVAVCMIVSDFMNRLENGVGKYNSDLVTRISKSPLLTESEKKKFYKAILHKD